MIEYIHDEQRHRDQGNASHRSLHPEGGGLRSDRLLEGRQEQEPPPRSSPPHSQAGDPLMRDIGWIGVYVPDNNELTDEQWQEIGGIIEEALSTSKFHEIEFNLDYMEKEDHW